MIEIFKDHQPAARARIGEGGGRLQSSSVTVTFGQLLLSRERREHLEFLLNQWRTTSLAETRQR
jgi:hypothetical protein